MNRHTFEVLRENRFVVADVALFLAGSDRPRRGRHHPGKVHVVHRL
jgi:hypothetical protein